MSIRFADQPWTYRKIKAPLAKANSALRVATRGWISLKTLVFVAACIVAGLSYYLMCGQQQKPVKEEVSASEVFTPGTKIKESAMDCKEVKDFLAKAEDDFGSRDCTAAITHYLQVAGPVPSKKGEGVLHGWWTATSGLNREELPMGAQRIFGKEEEYVGGGYPTLVVDNLFLSFPADGVIAFALHNKGDLAQFKVEVNGQEQPTSVEGDLSVWHTMGKGEKKVVVHVDAQKLEAADSQLLKFEIVFKPETLNVEVSPVRVEGGKD
ncbi:MAG: hypothetical protein NT099_02120 [Candidatus Saganbacteria bacterium]|nr:hypothetical protein [Candidatus Saganbacteria bacterium]